MEFTKMHGTGNDFIVIEDLNGDLESKQNNISKKICKRKFSIGADGVLFVRRSNIADIKMTIINSDGSYASMCGNGIRCFAKYVWEKGLVKKDIITIETGDGIKKAFINEKNRQVEQVTINMGDPSFNPKDIPALSNEEIINKDIIINDKNYKITSLLMGVPHTIVIGELNQFDIYEGKYIEKFNMFPEGTNVNFCEILNREEISVKTFERGAGPTMACGTGSCACVVVANKLGLVDNKVKVKVPGGELIIELKKTGVFMTGAAVISYKGDVRV